MASAGAESFTWLLEFIPEMSKDSYEDLNESKIRMLDSDKKIPLICLMSYVGVMSLCVPVC